MENGKHDKALRLGAEENGMRKMTDELERTDSRSAPPENAMGARAPVNRIIDLGCELRAKAVPPGPRHQ